MKKIVPVLLIGVFAAGIIKALLPEPMVEVPVLISLVRLSPWIGRRFFTTGNKRETA